MSLLLLLLFFFFLMLIGLPLYLALLSVAFAGIAVLGDASLLRVVSQQLFGGMDSFTLMAIPFFVLAGSLMNRSGLTDKLIDFSKLLVGSMRGGLGYVNIVAGIILAGVNGSAAADASALSSILIPAMKKEGYNQGYAAGLTAASSLIGPIIPPSIFMIIYASMTNTSIGGLFAAGVVPGLILGLSYAVMNYFYSFRYGAPISSGEERSQAKKILIQSISGLLAPIIIIGGIVTGVVTPTESGALAAAYCLLIGLFYTKKLDKRGIFEALYETVRTTSSIFLIMGAAQAVGWLLKWERIPQHFAGLLAGAGLTSSPVLLMLTFSAIIFVVGCFMEEVATLTLLTPIFYPLAMQAGIDPLHFGIVMTLNVTIALVTPPMGACNYIVSAVGKVPLSEVLKFIWPFIAVSLVALVLIILFPIITIYIPKALGL
ncbi:TRAP transporter, DctM subunit [Acetomicrobium mobile DSM 13181]|uniref:TRAP transporter, DctM subunit n=1 Tax=Acetomicrobium mobile (strain ATCC BAA-54 / DSM 13181 / JCM 12221 / NGA) TaxID=891968 RepID=I4BZ47_ACEMN|nr:TRAP transporter large permease [Acetomicrobium mobile]AFM22554.1 TRAP transporter, DctM subunit [Acetomicrobium mobile DSM 13181]